MLALIFFYRCSKKQKEGKKFLEHYSWQKSSIYSRALGFCSIFCYVATFKWNQHWLGLLFMTGFVVWCPIFYTQDTHRNVTNNKIWGKPCEKECPNFLVAWCYRRLPICLLTMKSSIWNHHWFLFPQPPAFHLRQKNSAVYFHQVIFCNWNLTRPMYLPM